MWGKGNWNSFFKMTEWEITTWLKCDKRIAYKNISLYLNVWYGNRRYDNNKEGGSSIVSSILYTFIV